MSKTHQSINKLDLESLRITMHMKCNIRKYIAIFALAILNVACSSVQLAPAESNISAKKFEVIDGKAVLYIVQDGGYLSSRALFQISVNGQPQGGLAGWTYHRLVLAPGNQTIVAASQENEQVLQINTPPGSIRFVSVPSIIGWQVMRVGDMKQLSEEDGKKAVLEANLARGLF